MPDLRQFKDNATNALATAILAHANPQSEQFRRRNLDLAVDAIAEYSCQQILAQYDLDARPRKP